MIAHLRGKLIARHPNQVIVETMGVGYDVTISVPTFSELPPAGSEIALHIHTHVREDQIALYGFLRSEEKHLFENLGYQRTAAEKALTSVEHDGAFDAMFRAALAVMAK